MPDDLLTRIRIELEDRLDESRTAREECSRLERALAALTAMDAPRPEREPTPARRRRPSTNGTRPPRAPRGRNRERVLAAVEARPGASPAEIAAASGVQGAVLYSLLARLASRGELEKEELPGGGTGYAVTTGGSDSDSSSPRASATSNEPSTA